MDTSYYNWIKELKDKIQRAQIKASLSVNAELICLYWEMGREIVEKQAQFEWGSKIIEQMAKDLSKELPNTSGFSRSNLFSMRRFYLFYQNTELVRQITEQSKSTEDQSDKLVHQAGGQLEKGSKELIHQAGGQLNKTSLLAQIPWRHHVLILQKTDDLKEAIFYIQETIQNNWSRSVLELQIQSDLFNRQGKATHNFELTLPKPQSDLATEMLKDPYKFDFLTLEKEVQELELERQLIDHIAQFLLELGKGFAYVGRQYPIQVGKKERRIDLLFYHLKMHCYIAIDLKTKEFEPEFVGKMNFYLSAIDDLVKTKEDNPSIGLILCISKDAVDIEYALRDINKPIGISSFSFQELKDEIKDNLPSREELEEEFKRFKE